jgi:peptide/nickel transport system permease protein
MDRGSHLGMIIVFAVPGFWLALLLMQLISIKSGWLPLSGLVSLDHEYLPLPQRIIDIASHLVLPLLVASIGGIVAMARYVRSSTIGVLQQPYILAARAKGVPMRSLYYRHILRNALLPVITILGLSIPGLLGGSVILESVFAIPGLGRLFYEAVMMRDYPLIMAEVMLTAVLTMAGNLCADIAYAYADPRVREGQANE